jgi:gliding motility-associated-like protein
MSKFKYSLLLIIFFFVANSTFSQYVSVPFKDGFIGSIGANTQQADNITLFSILGITKSSFTQQTLDGNFYYTQGNDIGGKLRLYFSSPKSVTISGVTTTKNYIDIDGAIVWQGRGGGRGEYLGFLPNPNTNITFNYSTSSTYSITRSSDGNTGSNIGNLRVDKTLTFTTNESGNAAGVRDDLNLYKTTVQSLDPIGPVTVNALTTTNQIPTLTGTATLRTGESLTVTVNGFVYSVGDGNLTISGNNWTLVIPNSLSIATYSVDAIITNADAYTLTDLTVNELVIQIPPPAGLTYTSPNVYTVGTAIGTLTPTSTGGAIASYSVSPSLPAGLTINTTTGVITGTPSAVSTQTSYVVTGTNASGTVTATVVMTVNPTPPLTLSYTSPNVYTVGTAIGTLTPTSTGGAIASYSVSPSLPAGLTINTTTGVITGIPSAVSTQTSYVVTGTNASGTVTATVVMTVNIAPPAGLTYTSPNVYTVGIDIGTLTPTSTGGAIASYSVSPSLPAGLTINSTTGVITGTPSAVSSQTSYVVTGTNASGTVTATVILTVENPPPPPAGLTYTSPNVYTVGTAIGTLTPTSTGGAIASYSVSPSLPAGLTINITTGVITGTPSAVSSQTSYVVTGTNASGTVTATVVMTVNIAPPAGLTYTSPNVYTVGTAIGTLTPTSTGGAIASYSVSPSLPAGLTINTTTGVITGTPSAVSTQTSYVVTGTNASGTVTATVVMTVNSNTIPQPQQPQGALNAVDFKLLANDTVILKLSVSNGTSPFTLILNNSYNTLKDTIKNLVPINSDVIFKLKQLDTTKIYTIFKLIDANDNVRSSGFTKDTTKVNVLKPKIVLNLKADPTVKQNDNSFKTKLLLKIKNVGDIDLNNVQVNANLSNALPQGIEYKLDSVRVLTGNLSINPNYNGAGSATAVSRIQNYITVLNSESKNTYTVLDQNYLFNNGISLNKNEEGEVVYYVSIGATTKNVSIKLQFETAAAGILTKSDGTSSSQVTKSKSDDGTNINEHPDLTNDGVPLPTYVPLIPNEKIGASLSVSASKLVAGGYEFHFIAKVKNFGNINLDSIRIEYDLTKLFPIPDQAVLVSNPIIKRGNIVYNASNYNGNTNIDLFKYGGDLQVGDSALYEYDLKVITNKTSFTWPNYFIVFGRSINSGLVIHDTSMAGLNPDPNNDNDPIEKFFTSVTINYKAPSPPVVENKTYVFGTNIPANIGGLVKSTPTGTIPVWCNEKTAACLILPPATPTQIGRYIFTLRSYDTTTLLYSEMFVYDTIIIKPPIPDVVNKKYVINNTNNPLNISSQVTGMAGSVINYYKNSILQSVVPILGSLPGTTRYTSSQIVNTIESDTVGFTITMLEPAALLHIQKLADEPKLQSNSTFNITYTFIVTNKTTEAMTNVLLEDNLQNTFPAPITFDVVSITSSGGLVFNNAFNGKTDIQLLKATSILAASAIDTLRLVVNLQPKGYNGTVNNLAIVTASSSYGPLKINSSSKANNEVSAKLPTPSVIPNLVIDIPEAFSPNRDGVNDRFVILKPFGTTLELEIFNRWGNVVYYNSNYNNDWDGRGTNNFIGQDLVDGGYYYTLKAKSANGNSQIFKGFVLIQR